MLDKIGDRHGREYRLRQLNQAPDRSAMFEDAQLTRVRGR